MAYQKRGPGDKGQNLFGQIIADKLTITGGSSITELGVGTFTVDTSSIAQSARESGTFTLSGATTGDYVLVWASTALDTGLSLMGTANVTATSTVTVFFVNETSAAVVQTSGLTNRYLHLRIA
jgi:hypothetical protein